MIKQISRRLLLILISFLLVICCYSQRYLSDLDSSLLYLNDTVRPLIKRFENLHFSGYIQPQFQLADTEGAKTTFSGGDSVLRMLAKRDAERKLVYTKRISLPPREIKATTEAAKLRLKLIFLKARYLPK